MYPRNAATPPRIAIGAVVQISDGAVQTSGVSVAVRAEGGSETAGGGTVSYGASSGIVYYAPTQAETNYTAFVVVAYKTGCIPVSQTVITTANATAGRVSVGDVAGTAQTGADLGTALTTALTEAYRADGATGSVAQLLYEIVAHLGESSISGTTKTIKRVDGSTTAATFTLDSGTTPTSITRAT